MTKSNSHTHARRLMTADKRFDRRNPTIPDHVLQKGREFKQGDQFIAGELTLAKEGLEEAMKGGRRIKEPRQGMHRPEGLYMSSPEPRKWDRTTVDGAIPQFNPLLQTDAFAPFRAPPPPVPRPGVIPMDIGNALGSREPAKKNARKDADLPLMDQFQAATFSKKENHEAQRVLTALRVKLKQAQRYVLDDDAVRLNCHLSHEKERIAGWSNLARIPYDTMWIEYNLHAEMVEFEKMGVLREAFEPDEVSEKVGYFLYKDNEDPQSARWVAHEIQIHSDGTVGTCTLAYVFDPEGNAADPVRGSQTWRSPTLSLVPGFKGPSVPHRDEKGDPCECSVVPEAMLCGAYILTHGGPDTLDFVDLDSEGKAGNPNTPHWFRHRAGAIIDPFWQRVAEDTGKLHDIARSQCIEQSAVMRRLITLLAAINGLPRDVRPIATRTGRRYVGMNPVPYLQHNLITLTLPRDDRVVWARKTLDHQLSDSHRKRHGVSGHWRIVERGKPLPPYFCHHEPEMVERGLAICARCEMLIRWIPQHYRGDASKGWVEHTYRVKAKRQTTRVELNLPRDFPPDLVTPVQNTIYSEPERNEP